MIDDSYLPCNSCGIWVDDGNLKNGDYHCHDCIDKPINKVEKTEDES